MKGYTLIQLIVAISLFSVIAGTMAYQFSTPIETIKLNAVVKAAASDLRNAQTKAVSTGSIQEMIFSHDSYQIDGKEKKLPPPIEIKNPQTVKFSPNLSPVPGYFGTIIFMAGKKAKSIVISPIGRIRVD